MAVEYETKMNKYIYNGPVTLYGKCVDSHWYGITYATTKAKALSNLTYQFKTQIGATRNTAYKLDRNYLEEAK